LIGAAVLALAGACGVLAIMPPRAPADALVTQTAEPTPVSAYGEVLAWSAYEDGSYRLMVKAGSNIDAVPTLPEPRAFDASVDLNQSKTPVVLFSRCRRYNNNPSQLLFGGPASDCRVYQYDVASGVVTPLALGQRQGESFTDPSQWESRVAVVATSRRGGTRVETIAIPSRRRSILPGSTLKHGLVSSLRIVGGRVAATWYAARGLETEVVLDTVDDKREILEEGEQGTHASPQIANPTGSEFYGAGLAGQEAYWVEPGDPLIGTPSVVEFYDPLTQTSTVGEGVPDVFSVAPDGTALYYSTGSNAGGCPCGVFER
jgi:hypothetical protein